MILKMRNIMSAMKTTEKIKKKTESCKGNLLQSNQMVATPSSTGGDVSSVGSATTSNQPSVEMNRPESGAGLSPSDELDLSELPSANPSPFSFSGVPSFTEIQEISSIASDVSSTTFNDIQI